MASEYYLEQYDSERHGNYQYLAEVWYSKFGTILTKGNVDLSFIDPNYSSFSKDLLTSRIYTRPTLNDIIEESVGQDNMVWGLRGIMYDVDELNDALDQIREDGFYAMVEREEIEAAKRRATEERMRKLKQLKKSGVPWKLALIYSKTMSKTAVDLICEKTNVRKGRIINEKN